MTNNTLNANSDGHDERADNGHEVMANAATFIQSLFPDQMDPGAETFGADTPTDDTEKQ